MRLQTVALLGLLLIGEAVGQESTPELDRASREGKEAFQCAALAAEATAAIKPNASKLAFIAHEKTKQVMDFVVEGLKANDGTAGGPLTEYIKHQDSNFLVALGFAEANVTITKFLDAAAPFDGSNSYEVIRQNRDWAAEAEYQHRNCDLFLL